LTKNTSSKDYSEFFKSAKPGGIPTIKSDNSEFTVYSVWSFEGESIGEYTDAEIAEDFNYDALYPYNSASIVVDKIKGVDTKVMCIKHPSNTLGNGFEMVVNLGTEYNEIYLSYNWKFSNEFNSTEGGKLPGLGGLPDFGSNCPSGKEGFRAHNMQVK